MKTRKLIATVAGGALLAGVLATPAMADSGSTTVTFTLNTGGLEIAAPAGPAALAADASTVEFSGTLGDTTVTDNRNSTAGWVASAYSSDFRHADYDPLAPDPTLVIGAANVHIAVGGSPVVDLLGAVGETLDPGTPVFSATAGTAGDDPTTADVGGTPVRVGGKIGEVTSASLLGAVDSLVDTLIGGVLFLGNDVRHEVAYDPTVTVNVPADKANGAYTGTITQTVL